MQAVGGRRHEQSCQLPAPAESGTSSKSGPPVAMTVLLPAAAAAAACSADAAATTDGCCSCRMLPEPPSRARAAVSQLKRNIKLRARQGASVCSATIAMAMAYAANSGCCATPTRFKVFTAAGCCWSRCSGTCQSSCCKLPAAARPSGADNPAVPCVPPLMVLSLAIKSLERTHCWEGKAAANPY